MPLSWTRIILEFTYCVVVGSSLISQFYLLWNEDEDIYLLRLLWKLKNIQIQRWQSLQSMSYGRFCCCLCSEKALYVNPSHLNPWKRWIWAFTHPYWVLFLFGNIWMFYSRDFFVIYFTFRDLLRPKYSSKLLLEDSWRFVAWWILDSGREWVWTVQSECLRL